MKEANFNTEVVNSIKAQGWFAHKLTDTPRVPGLRFISEKPFDIFAVAFGTPIAIESKQFKKYQGFSLRYLRENQIEALDKMLHSGGRAFIFLNIRIPTIKGVQKRENRCLIIDWATWDKEQIPVKVIKEMPYIGGKNGLFDLWDFLRQFNL